MSVESRLSRGGLRRLVEEESKEPLTVQIVSWRPVSSTADKPGPDRARLHITDGQYLVSNAVGVGRIVEELKNGNASEGALVKIYETQMMSKDKDSIKVLVIKNADILIPSHPTIFGKNAIPLLGSKKEAAAPAKVPLASSNGPAQPHSAAGSGLSHQAAASSTGQGFRRTADAPAVGANPVKKSRMEMPPGTVEIQALNPYLDKFKIRARVTGKDELREWNNARGSGCLFSMELTDHSGSIRATAFKEEAQKFFQIVQQGKVYDVVGGRLKPANKRYNSTKHDYELTFDRGTEMLPVTELAGAPDALPTQLYHFVKIADLPNKHKDDMVDVVGVLKSVGDVAKLISKAGRELTKRDVVLVDDSAASVSLTLWGALAENFQGTENRVLAAKAVRLGDFGGVSLSTVSSSQLELDLEQPRAMELMGWWGEGGNAADVSALTNRGGGGSRDPTLLLIDMVESFRLGTDPVKPDYFNCRAMIANVKAQEALYKACPQEQCNKRVVEAGQDAFRCEKCQQDFDKFKYAAMIQVKLMDLSGTHWLTMFGVDSCKALTGHTPAELGVILESSNDEYEAVFNKLLFRPFVFRLSARQETYNDNTTVKWRCYSVRTPTAEDEDQWMKQMEDVKEKLHALPAN